ncbi:MAG: response regulator transcription factor [Bacillota bacterium]|nr:response regulator transcription factor [Bacillota bacterium]
MANILIADDEERMRRLVSDFLKRDGCHVLQAKDGKEAIDVVDLNIASLDLVILDIMMPVLDGWSVLRHIRKLSQTLPVVMLTARNEDVDEAFGFELGADDYISKPFSPIVLSARVRSILRRRAEKSAPQIEQLGNILINEFKREVRIDDDAIILTPKEYELLIYFKNNKNIALSREKILNTVWGYDYFGDLRTVDTHVKKLRAKLSGDQNHIQTVRGYGYRFEVEE